MKTWAKILGVVAVLITTGALAANAVFPSGSWRYRMTVEVETPEGLKTGSAVREVTVHRGIALTPESLPSVQVKGEAVAVDLGERGMLFALMDSDGSYQVVFDAFGWTSGGTTPEGIKYFSTLRDAKATLTPKQYPMLVRFRDIGDPKTVERVDPKNLAATFGDGVILKAVTIEMTDDPVTSTIAELLRWLPSRKGMSGYLGGSPEPPYEDPTKTYLQGLNFKKGDK